VRGARRWLGAVLVACWTACMAEPPNTLLLVAKPSLVDPNFSRTVVLVTRAEDASTVGVILNRPTTVRHERTGEPIYSGGPVMPRTLVALFPPEGVRPASSFHVLQGIYLSMHPQIVERRQPRTASTPASPAGCQGNWKARSRATAGICCRPARASAHRTRRAGRAAPAFHR